jgi:transmembrane sensor
MPTNSSLEELFSKYVKGAASLEETSNLFAQMGQMGDDAELARLLDAEIHDTPFADEYDQAWETTLGKIKLQISETPVVSIRKNKDNLWLRISSIAAIIMVVFGIYFFGFRDKGPNFEHLTANDIPPGKMGATLTLADGKKISLAGAANGELVKESGLSISKTADGQVIYRIEAGRSKANGTNTLTTAIGQTYILTLPDQTKVWLNAASSLTYNSAGTVNGIRRVKLTGEGYFEVAKDRKHPFIVESGTQTVEVLGTHFNIKAYPDETAYRTTLVEGSVRIEDKDEVRILKPGNQASNTGGNINVSPVDTEFAIAWKSNNFVFDRLDIKEIMKMIARWYNVEVIYEGEIPSGSFWGSVSRFEDISKVLIPLEATGDVHFKISGRKIYVRR